MDGDVARRKVGYIWISSDPAKAGPTSGGCGSGGGDVVYIYIYICICVCVHTYVRVCACVHVCMYLVVFELDVMNRCLPNKSVGRAQCFYWYWFVVHLRDSKGQNFDL